MKDKILEAYEKMLINESLVVEASLTKKHFISLANMMKTAKTLDELKKDILEWLIDSNPRFDIERFKKAAGMNEQTEIVNEAYTQKELDKINVNADTVNVQVSDYDGNKTKYLGMNDKESCTAFKKFVDQRMKTVKK